MHSARISFIRNNEQFNRLEWCCFIRHDSELVSCLGILNIKIYLCTEPLSLGFVRSDV